MTEAQKFWAGTPALESFSEAKGRTSSLELDARAWSTNASHAVAGFNEGRGRDHEHRAGVQSATGMSVEVTAQANAASHTAAFMKEMRLAQAILKGTYKDTIHTFKWDAQGIIDFL